MDDETRSLATAYEWAAPVELDVVQERGLAASSRSDRANMWTWIAWLVFVIVVVCVKFGEGAIAPGVFDIYQSAADRWRTGANLYGHGEFLYLPTAAVGFLGLADVPSRWGGAIWRAANVLIFLWGVRSVGTLAPPSEDRRFFPVVSALAIVLSWSAARHGQMTLAMAGLMLAGVAELDRERWWRAAAFLSLSVALKPLSVVLVLLVMLTYVRVAWRVVVCGGLLFALPFAFQETSYVLAQYQAVPEMLSVAADRARTQSFAQFFGLLETAGVYSSKNTQAFVRGLAALACLVLCFQARRKLSGRESAMFLFSLSTGYILLFGCGTERNTYALMAPALGWVVIDLFSEGRRSSAWALLCIGATCLTSHRLSKLFPDTPLAMVKPMVCVVLTSLTAFECWRRVRD